jgi:hypothetical protein
MSFLTWQGSGFYGQTYKSLIFFLCLCLTLILTACDSQNMVTGNSIETTPLTVPVTPFSSSTVLSNLTKLAGLTPTPPTPALVSPTNTTISQDWEYHWLKGIPCRVPCFEGIIVGQTSAEEAFKLLSQNPLVANLKNYNDGDKLTWKWLFDKEKDKRIIEEYSALGLSELQDGKKKISTISPRFSRADFTLRDVISAYGEPSHISVNALYDYNHINQNFLYHLVIFYLPQGFAITHNPFTKYPLIDPNLTLDTVVFFTPNKPQPYHPIYNDPNALVRWQGYKSFEF